MLHYVAYPVAAALHWNMMTSLGVNESRDIQLRL